MGINSENAIFIAIFGYFTVLIKSDSLKRQEKRCWYKTTIVGSYQHFSSVWRDYQIFSMAFSISSQKCPVRLIGSLKAGIAFASWHELLNINNYTISRLNCFIKNNCHADYHPFQIKRLKRKIQRLWRMTL